jgi:hypothetical protein
MQQPRVLVIGGNPGRWNARERAQLAPYATGIEAWVHATQGVYIDHTSVSLRDVNQFDIVICNTNQISSSSAVEKYARLAENRRDSVLWVSLLEGDMRHYMRPSPFVRRALDASTLVNCINHNATESIQQTTSARVAYIGGYRIPCQALPHWPHRCQIENVVYSFAGFFPNAGTT